MGFYEIDTVKSAMKKYVVTIAIGVCIGIGMTTCAYRKMNSSQTSTSSQTMNKHYLTREEQRMQTFETYTQR